MCRDPLTLDSISLDFLCDHVDHFLSNCAKIHRLLMCSRGFLYERWALRLIVILCTTFEPCIDLMTMCTLFELWIDLIVSCIVFEPLMDLYVVCTAYESSIDLIVLCTAFEVLTNLIVLCFASRHSVSLITLFLCSFFVRWHFDCSAHCFWVFALFLSLHMM